MEIASVVAVAVALRFEYDESLGYHKSWVDLAEMAQSAGGTFSTRDDGELAVELGKNAAILRVSASSLSATSIDGHLPTELLSEYLAVVAPDGVSRAHFVLWSFSSVSGSKRSARSRMGSKVAAAVGLEEVELRGWRTSFELATECEPFEFASVSYEVLDQKEARERMPDKGLVIQRDLPKTGIWSSATHHLHSSILTTSFPPLNDLVEQLIAEGKNLESRVIGSAQQKG